MKLLFALVGLGFAFMVTAKAAPQMATMSMVADFAQSSEKTEEVSSTIPCASGGPVSESFYESMYSRCLETYCPGKCTYGGRASGEYYTNHYYNIVCICY